MENLYKLGDKLEKNKKTLFLLIFIIGSQSGKGNCSENKTSTQHKNKLFTFLKNNLFAS